jgi:hypothetical protein
VAQIHPRFEERNHRLPSSVARTCKRSAAICVVRAELIGTNCAVALGFIVRSPSPVLALCRTLVEARHDPTTPLYAYRGSTLAFKVRSIGEGAKLTVEDNHLGRPTFRRRRDRPQGDGAGPPIALMTLGMGSPRRVSRTPAPYFRVSARPTGWHQQTKTILNFAAAAAKRAARIAVTIGQEGDSHGR